MQAAFRATFKAVTAIPDLLLLQRSMQAALWATFDSCSRAAGALKLHHLLTACV